MGVAVAALTPWATITLPAWVAGHALFISPTALQPFIQKKGFKIASRISLGAASASYFLSGLGLQSYFSNSWL